MAAEDNPPPAPNQTTGSQTAFDDHDGPGAVGIDLSHLETKIDDLSRDNALSRAEHQLYGTFYAHRSAKLELHLSILDLKERMFANNEALVALQNRMEWACSDEGKQELTREWLLRKAGEALGGDKEKDSAVGTIPDDPVSEEIKRAENKLKAIRSELDQARVLLQTFASNMEVLSREDTEQEKSEPAIRKWELSRQWESITPQELQAAVAAIRHEFEHSSGWQTEQSASKLCEAALNPPSSADQPKSQRT